MGKENSIDVKIALFLKKLFNYYVKRRTSGKPKYILNSETTLIEKGLERDLYRTKSGSLMWLNKNNYIDQCILETGYFEQQLSEVAQKLVKEGDYILDIGANIGYYTLMFSRLAGNNGKVICFEPTDFYGKILKKNIEANKIKNIEVLKYGLSNKSQELKIHIGGSTASVHNPGNFLQEATETIQLKTLDEHIKSNPVARIDFIKLDIDGHEPHFFEGAWETIEKYDPIILMEISHLHYLEAGFNVWDFYEKLVSKKYRIYHENDLTEITSKTDFLIKCGNFNYSSNIVLSRKELQPIN